MPPASRSRGAPILVRSNQAAVVLAQAIILALACILFPNTTLAQDEKLYNLYTKARAAQQAGDFQTAAGHYEEFVRLRPDLAEAHANLGSIYYQIRDDERRGAGKQSD